MKVIVAHPGKQHSYRLASALKKHGILMQYITTIYPQKNSLMFSVINLFLSAENKKRAQKRYNPDLDDNDVSTFNMFYGLLETLLVRLDKSRNLYRKFSDFTSKRFGISVAKYAINNKADAVVCYDSNSTSCFEYLKNNAPNIIRIMDVSSTARPYRKIIYEEEISRSGHDDLRIQNQYMWDDDILHNLQQEIDDTNYFLAPSKFVINSLVNCGVKKEQILYVPYGANIISNLKKEKFSSSQTINFLFVGQVNYNKGVPYLLEAFSKLNNKNISLTIVGEFNQNDWYIKKFQYLENLHFAGYLTFDRMKNMYEESHVFVFPSFSEGMTLSGIEAMACGLPIICTPNSGVSDLVTDGENGFIVDAGNADSLKSKMEWFISHSDRIKIMGENASRIAINYTWARYEENIVRAVLKIKELNNKN